MQLGLLIIHGLVGLLFAGHGAQKLFGWFGGRGLDRTGAGMASMGLLPGRLMAAGAGAGELTGGLLLALGLFTPLAAALLVAVGLVAARTAHADKGLWNAEGGWELVMVLAVVSLGLAFNGAGAWSLDAAIGWDVAGLWWGIGSAAVGLAGGAAVLARRHRRTSESGASGLSRLSHASGGR
jgi:putative oxidoreductase